MLGSVGARKPVGRAGLLCQTHIDDIIDMSEFVEILFGGGYVQTKGLPSRRGHEKVHERGSGFWFSCLCRLSDRFCAL